jgi:hypothetical protein
MSENPHGGRVPDIPDLLQHHFDTTGEKQADVVARAQRAGCKLSRQQLSKFAAGLSCPEPEAVRALAVGLHTTQRAVWLSVGASLGLELGAPQLADRIDPAAADLPGEVQDAFNLLLRSVGRNLERGPYAPHPGVTPRDLEEGDGPRVVRWPKDQAPSQRRARQRQPNGVPKTE